MLRSNALVSSSILVHPLIVQIQFHRPDTIANFSTGSEPLFFQMSHLCRLLFFSETYSETACLVRHQPVTCRSRPGQNYHSVLLQTGNFGQTQTYRYRLVRRYGSHLIR